MNLRVLMLAGLFAVPLPAIELPIFDLCREGIIGLQSSARTLTADDHRWITNLAERLAARIADGKVTPAALWQDLATAAEQRHIGSYSEFERLFPRLLDTLAANLRRRVFDEPDRLKTLAVRGVIQDLDRSWGALAKPVPDRPEELIRALAPELTLPQVASLKAVRLLTKSFPDFGARLKRLARPEYFAGHEGGDHFAFEPMVSELLKELGLEAAGPFERDFLRRAITNTLVNHQDVDVARSFDEEVVHQLRLYQTNHEHTLTNREPTIVARDGYTYLQIPIPVRVVDEALSKEFRLAYSGSLDASKHIPPNRMFEYKPISESEILVAARLTEEGRAVVAFGDIATHSLLHLTPRAPVADFISVDPKAGKYYVTEVKHAREMVSEEQFGKAIYQMRETARSLKNHLDGASFPIEAELAIPDYAMPLIARDTRLWQVVDGRLTPIGKNPQPVKETGSRKYAAAPVVRGSNLEYVLCEVRNGQWEVVIIEGQPVRILTMKKAYAQAHRDSLTRMGL